CVLCMCDLALVGTAMGVALFYFSIRHGRRVRKTKANPAGTGSPVPDPLHHPPSFLGGYPVPVQPVKKPWAIRTYPALLQMCLVTFMVGGFFLSRTYTPP